jgi:putative membrane protein
MRRLGIVVALTMLGGGGALAETGAAGGGGDRNFVDRAAAGGMAEVKLATLAMDRGSSMQVKNFARKMLEDHSKANTELKGIAEDKSMALPTALDAKHQEVYDKLVKLDGAAFDREYMKAMTDDHDDTVKLFKDEVAKGQDPDLRSFASKTLPVLEKHDTMAHDNLKKK